jgi:hypothetical protein
MMAWKRHHACHPVLRQQKCPRRLGSEFRWLLMAVTIQETATWMETKHEDGNAQEKRAGKRQVSVTQQACIGGITGAPQCASFQKVK